MLSVPETNIPSVECNSKFILSLRVKIDRTRVTAEICTLEQGRVSIEQLMIEEIGVKRITLARE